jgi:hypothetical protein
VPIKVDGLTNEITRALEDYSDEITDSLEQAKDEISKEAVADLKQTSRKLTGDYAKSWSRKKTAKGYVIYNKDHYQLTHLLEFGHMKRNGGRTQAFPHIGPEEQKVIEKFTSAAEKAVRE